MIFMSKAIHCFSWCIWELLKYVSWNIWEFSKFVSAPGLAWQAALKKTKVKLVLLTGIEYVTLFIDMQKLKTNTWKIIVKRKTRRVFNIGM